MAVEKYRSIEEMPPPWRDGDDPGNLRRIAEMMSVWFRLNRRPEPGVRRIEPMADGNDPYRDPPRDGEG